MQTNFLAPSSGTSPNPIQTENSNPGTPGWQLSNPATNREIEGYASLTSVNIGNKIDLFVSTNDSTFKIDIFRTGWYAGIGARLMTTVNNLTGKLQPTPPPDPATGLIECNWTSSFTLNVPATWVSGIFLARLTGNQSGKQSFIIFVVRDDARKSDLIYQSSFTTFQAYNFWPAGQNGKSLYDFAPGGRAWKVSFNRPYVLGLSYSTTTPGTASGVGAGEYLTNVQPGPQDGYPIPPAGFEYNMVRWLEKSGYDVTYITNIDLHENGNLLMNHKGYLSVGHNEYWSMQMRQSVETALNNGVDLGFFSSNTLYWQIRLEPASDGTPNRTMVCYKGDAPTQDPEYNTNPQLATVEWRSAPVNLPEAGLLGVEYVGDPVESDIVIANSSHWLLDGSGLKDGDHLTGLLGYEVDTMVPGGSPAGTEILACSPVGPLKDQDFPPGIAGAETGTSEAHVTWYRKGNASVFATGTMQWSWGLDDYNAPALRPAVSSPAVEQITKNLLASMINPLTITVPSVLPAAMLNMPYQLSMSVLGGTPPFVWTASGLPAYLSLSPSGVLAGTPPAQATIQFTVQVTDANHLTTWRTFTLTTNPAHTTSAISINFVGQGSAMAPTEIAGAVAKTYWNNALSNMSTTPLILSDENGMQNGARATWSADNPWSTPTTEAPGNARMMKGYLDTGNANPSTVNVSGLVSSPNGYDIYVYLDSDNESAAKTATYSISGPGITTTAITATDPANTNFSGTFQQAVNSTGNYVKFAGVHTTAFTLTATPTQASDSVLRAPINGLQIIPSA